MEMEFDGIKVVDEAPKTSITFAEAYAAGYLTRLDALGQPVAPNVYGGSSKPTQQKE